jgi:hypothetical protein
MGPASMIEYLIPRFLSPDNMALARGSLDDLGIISLEEFDATDFTGLVSWPDAVGRHTILYSEKAMILIDTNSYGDFYAGVARYDPQILASRDLTVFRPGSDPRVDGTI